MRRWFSRLWDNLFFLFGCISCYRCRVLLYSVLVVGNSYEYDIYLFSFVLFNFVKFILFSSLETYCGLLFFFVAKSSVLLLLLYRTLFFVHAAIV